MGNFNCCCNKKTKELNNVEKKKKPIKLVANDFEESCIIQYNPKYNDGKDMKSSNENAILSDFFTSHIGNDNENVVKLIQSTLKTPINLDIFGLIPNEEQVLTLLSSNKQEYKFNVISLLGSGSFGKVYLVRYQENKEVYAMKVVDKKMVKTLNSKTSTMRERFILEKINSPFIVKLEFAFQSKDSLFFITEFGQGGELFYHLMINKYFTEERTKLYIAEIILALEAIHNSNCIYRDLKPDNILIDKNGNIKLTDFGLSKISLEKVDDKSNSIVGTPGYFAPEVLFNPNYDNRVDFWSLGVIMFQMLEGEHPYESIRNVNPTKRNQEKVKGVMVNKPIFKRDITPDAKDLCYLLLSYNPEDRPINTNALKSHQYFSYLNEETLEPFDWCKVINKEYIPQFVPALKNDVDTKYFHRFYTEQATDSLIFRENNKNKLKQTIETSDSLKEENFSTSMPKLTDNRSSGANDYKNFTYVNSCLESATIK